jgi:hypothetical protein
VFSCRLSPKAPPPFRKGEQNAAKSETKSEFAREKTGPLVTVPAGELTSNTCEFTPRTGEFNVEKTGDLATAWRKGRENVEKTGEFTARAGEFTAGEKKREFTPGTRNFTIQRGEFTARAGEIAGEKKREFTPGTRNFILQRGEFTAQATTGEIFRRKNTRTFPFGDATQ